MALFSVISQHLFLDGNALIAVLPADPLWTLRAGFGLFPFSLLSSNRVRRERVLLCPGNDPKWSGLDEGRPGGPKETPDSA